MGNEAIDLEEILEEISQDSAVAEDQGDAGELETVEAAEEVSKARIIALEECLHTLAGYALELETGKRESITAEDIRVAFAAHEVEEIYEEAKIFFDAGEEDSDLEDPGTEGAGASAEEQDDDLQDAGDEGLEEDFEGDEAGEES